LDIVLATEQVRSDAERRFDNHLIAEYPVSLVCARGLKIARGKFPEFLRHVSIVLPGRQSTMREPFDALLAKAGITPHVIAEVDDIAMLRLLAREGAGVTLVPPIAVQDELRSGELRQICEVPNLRKAFYAVTLHRQFPNDLVRELIRTFGSRRKFQPRGTH
jgi:LysR family transcriptional activator of nhaA